MVAPAQMITLRSTAPARSVTGIRGQTAPAPTGGFGGWQTVARPHRKALTEWDGIDPLELTFSLIFDGGVDRSSIEAQCLTLEEMSQPVDRQAPPPISVAGAVPHSELAWVISGLAWDPAPEYSKGGYRTRHEVTLTLLEHVAADKVQTAAAAARSQVAPSTSRVYTVRAGDTLVSIAAAQLGDFTRWTQIAALNGLRDPNRLTVGQKLRLP